MSDSTQDDSDPNLRALLEIVHEDVCGIVDEAKASGMNRTSDAFMHSLVTSGVCLAYEKMAHGQKDSILSSRVLSALKSVVEGVDALTETNPELRERVQGLSAQAAALLKENQDRIEAAISDILRSRFGLRAEKLLLLGGEYTDDEAFEVGLGIYGYDPQAFRAFVMYHDDTSMKCPCMSHLVERYVRSDVGHAETDAKERRDFRSRKEALEAFGRHFSGRVDDFLPEPLRRSKPLTVEEAMAHRSAHKYLTSLAQRSKGNSSSSGAEE